MAKAGASLRDIFIGIILLLIGAASLLHNFNIISINESMALLWVSYGFAGIGVVLLLSYFVKPSKFWLFILSLCSFFIAATIYLSNFMPGQEDLIGVSLFLLLALGFLGFFVVKPSQWWGLLVGWICIGLAGTVYATTSVVQIPVLRNIPSDTLAPLLLFSSIALGFLFVWIISPRNRWWSLLTAGMIVAVESIVLMEYLNTSDPLKPVMLFLITGVVFLLVWLLRNEEYKLGWAIYPALVLISFAAFLYLVAFWMNNSKLVISLIFLIVGALFVLNYFRARLMGGTREKEEPRTRVYESARTTQSDDDFWKEKPGRPESVKQESGSGMESQEKESLLAEPADEKLEEKEEEQLLQPPVDYPIDPQTDDDDEKKN